MSECCGGRPMVYVEIPGVWDGALYYECECCGKWRHRFAPGDYRRKRGELKSAFPPEEDHHPDDKNR